MSNQKSVAAPIQMDSRKFLSSLNDSAQAKIAFIESRIEQMGRATGKTWRLAALRTTNLFINEEETGGYFQADYHREKGGRIVIENVQAIKIVESQKSKLFHESCVALVNAIDENDQKAMGTAFTQMGRQRFSSRAVPFSGQVRTRDGVTRSINIQTDRSLDEHARVKLIAAIVESVKDSVTVTDGVVIEGKFNDGAPLKLPVTKWSKHKMVARQMQEVAKNAYWSAGFQDRVYKVAELIHEDKIDEAVKSIAPFLQENEEFTLLTAKQTHALVENALAANGLFNQQLCDDTAVLVYRTNLRVNKGTIVKEWKRIARAAQHPTLLENTNILGNSKHFEAAHDKFIRLVFEAMSNREVTAEALATTLEVLRDRTPKIKESHELASKLNDLISRLKNREFDDNAIYEAEDFIATVQEELTSNEDLRDFDDMPGDNPGMGDDSELAGAADGVGDALSAEQGKPSATPGVVFNAPLIQIGADAAKDLGLGGDEGDDLGDELDLGGEEGAEGGLEGAEGGQDDLLAGGQQAGQAGGALNFPESRGRGRNKLAEEWDEEKYGEAPWKKGKSEKKDSDSDSDSDADSDDDSDSDSDDPYKFGESVNRSSEIGADYGTLAIGDSDTAMLVVNAMTKLAEEHQLSGTQLNENLQDLALAGLEATGMRLPPRKINHAVEQLIKLFKEYHIQDEEELEDDDHIVGLDANDGPAEDQFKWGTVRRKGGLKRSSIGKTERGKKTSSESITWLEKETHSMLGEMAGVKFVLDHSPGHAGLAVLSEDGNIEIAVPGKLTASARAAAGLANGNTKPFQVWLEAGLEQLRPETDDENTALDQGMGEFDQSGGGEFGGEMGGEPDMMGGESDELGGMEPAGDELTGGDELGADEFGGDELGADEFGGAGPEAGLEDDMLDGGLDGEADGELDGAVVTIKTSPDGAVSIQVDTNGAEVVSPDEDGLDDELDDMAPVDSVKPPGPAGPPGEEGEESEGEEGEEFPDFGGAVGADEGEETEPAAEGEPEADADGGEEFPDDMAEDSDVTDPKSSKYTKEVKADLRQVPDVKLPGKGGDKLDGFNNKNPQKASKGGSDTKTARKGE